MILWSLRHSSSSFACLGTLWSTNCRLVHRLEWALTWESTVVEVILARFDVGVAFCSQCSAGAASSILDVGTALTVAEVVLRHHSFIRFFNEYNKN